MQDVSDFKLLVLSNSQDMKDTVSEICYKTKCFQINCVDRMDALESILEHKVSLFILHTDVGENEIIAFLEVLKGDDECKYVPVVIVSELQNNEELSKVCSNYSVIAIYTYKTWHLQIGALVSILKTYIEEEKSLHNDIQATQTENLIDPLTGVYNRRGGEKAFSNHVRDFFWTHETFSCVAIDIDHFKNINDRYGHNIGDEVLIEMAECFLSSIRLEDSFIRFGGEEFGLFLSNCNLMNAVEKVERIRKMISEKLFSSQKLHVTVSMGVCEYKEGMSLHHLVNDADELLYIAKSEGRNRVVFTKE